jgi:hypothetical protein
MMKKHLLLCLISSVGLMLANTDVLAVRVLDQTAVISDAIRHIGFGWSDDNKYFIASEFDSASHRQHLCIYSVSELKKIKCVLALYPEADYFVGLIAWTGNTLYVDEGYEDGRAVIRYDITGWDVPSFREIDGGRKGAGEGIKDSGGWPVWDRWMGGLYFQRGWAEGDIYFYKDGRKRRVVESGFSPSISKRYLWYVLDEPRAGLYRRERSTFREVRIDDRADSISATLNDDLLYVKHSNGGGHGGVVFAYQIATGICTQLFVVHSPTLSTTKDIREVAVSPDGHYALVEIISTDEKRELSPVSYRLMLLKLEW